MTEGDRAKVRMQARIAGFPPISRSDARVLVLGSMPGVASLRTQQYYAHPRNAFWPIMGALFGFDPGLPYSQRVDALLAHRVAVWDVLAACQRPGSLDADIDPQTMQVNDFAAFLRSHPGIVRLCFNGLKAHEVFRRQVLPQLDRASRLEMLQLPSTSPAHAGMAAAAKQRAWQVVNTERAGPAGP